MIELRLIGESGGDGIGRAIKPRDAGPITVGVIIEGCLAAKGVGDRFQRIISVILVSNGLLFWLAQGVCIAGDVARGPKRNAADIPALVKASKNSAVQQISN
jgi:hypothetical protein